MNGYRHLEGAQCVKDQAAHWIYDPEEEGTKTFQNVGEIHQSTWRDIEEDANLPEHRSDKLKCHKYLRSFITLERKFI